MLKKLMMLSILALFFCAGFAGNEAVLGDWDCKAYVDMTYPFVMTLEEGENGLSGIAKSNQGSMPLDQVAFEEDALTFKLSHPDAGIIDFKTKVIEDTIEGTLGNYSFQGTLKCARPSSE